MFIFDAETSAVTMHRGDTGAYYANCARKSGKAFSAGDVALYTVKLGSKTMIEREYDLAESNGRFLIAFRNADTDTWAAGSYSTELRVVINPIREDGKVVDGDVVRTIGASKSTLTILDVAREV